ncbi:MAG: hypothetical protein JZD41_02595 [Thermoproteus sp.]|nr:hypothetical protein [Thermoproteus sp.]
MTTESSVKRALVRMEGHYFDKFLGESNEIIMSSEFSLIDIYGLSLGDKSGDWFNEKPKFKIMLIP